MKAVTEATDTPDSKNQEVIMEKSMKGQSKTRAKRKRNAKVVRTTGMDTEIGGFTVIGDANLSRKRAVEHVLPDWLVNPSIISCNLKEAKVPINALKLDPDLVSVLEENFIPYFFPVQYQVIPRIIKAYTPRKLYRPSDLCVSAPTGSGKTLAYVLPLIQILKNSTLESCVRAIIVLPTEVLANQVYNVFKTFGKGSGLNFFLMSKRLTLSSERDLLISRSVTGVLSTPYDIIIATPGRLVDHLEKSEGFDISRLQFLVVDEADRTLDDQEGDWLSRLEGKFWSQYPIHGMTNAWKSFPLTPRFHSFHLKAFQKLLFSATLSNNPDTLEKLHLFQPKLLTSVVGGKKAKIEVGTDADANPDEASSTVQTPPLAPTSDSFVGKFTTPMELKESFVLCQKRIKPMIVAWLISQHNWKRVLCFTNTKESTHRLCLLLKHMGNVSVREVSAKWSTKARDLVLKQFSDGKIDILVTSDQMARGIDIPIVDHVISYDLPSNTKTYVHRVGRCARAGREGHAVTLVEKDKIGIYKKTMKSADKTNYERIVLKNSDLKKIEEDYKKALAKLKADVETSKTKVDRNNVGIGQDSTTAEDKEKPSKPKKSKGKKSEKK